MLNRVLLTLLCLSLAASAQSTATAKKTPSKTPAAQASAAPAAAPTAIIHTTLGDMKCQLMPDKAPKAVANFVGLATGTKDWTDPVTGKKMHNKPLYDGVIFHRVIPEFMIQGGDPQGDGRGNPGYKFEDELHADLLFDKPGRLAMANSGLNTNGSQFFITEKEVPFLNPCFDPNGCMGGRRAPNSGYTIFGQCDDNTVELVKKIARMPRGAQDRPNDPVKIQHIEIQGIGRAGAKPATKKTAAKKARATAKPTTPKP